MKPYALIAASLLSSAVLADNFSYNAVAYSQAELSGDDGSETFQASVSGMFTRPTGPREGGTFLTVTGQYSDVEEIRGFDLGGSGIKIEGSEFTLGAGQYFPLSYSLDAYTGAYLGRGDLTAENSSLDDVEYTLAGFYVGGRYWVVPGGVEINAKVTHIEGETDDGVTEERFDRNEGSVSARFYVTQNFSFSVDGTRRQDGDEDFDIVGASVHYEF
jgi:hypothetical protein